MALERATRVVAMFTAFGMNFLSIKTKRARSCEDGTKSEIGMRIQEWKEGRKKGKKVQHSFNNIYQIPAVNQASPSMLRLKWSLHSSR